ncbi:MAG TPA: MmgE/PrpD family protein [Streptosporangiaceae bacterium]|nr:MmgE/PrpD family protein [Streptosporangiaceae bacterium]
MTLIENLSRWASSLDLDDVPDRVVRFASSQVLSQLAAARAGAQHPLGQAVIRGFGEPWQARAEQSAFVLAGLTSWLHYDDTAYAGHLSNSTATVPMAYAHALGLDGRRLLTAVIAANECAARITAAATLGRFRGQNAAHTHLAGAVSGRLRAEGAPVADWVNALGIAFSMPPWPSLRAFLGSDAKVLSAALPVRLGLDACDAARAGLVGPRDILEHPDGFLAAFAAVPLPDAVDLALGRRWHTETLSFKVHPGGPGLDAAVDCAAQLHRVLGPVALDDVDEVVVTTSMYTLLVDQKAAEFLDRERSPVSALVFCTPYAVATTLLTGGLTAADFGLPSTADEQRWRLAAKIRLEHDAGMTRESLLSEAPFGEALRQAGPRAAKWLEEVGTQWLVDLVGELPAPNDSFETATKATPARVEVRLRTGETYSEERSIPAGAIGPDTRARHHDIVRAKFLAVGGPAQTADIAADLPAASAADVREMLSLALR